jgi:phosphatidylglycerophosphatase A
MSNKNPEIVDLNRKVMKNPIHFLAFGFGSGLAPFAPGTFGTLIAIPLYLLMLNFSFSMYLLLVAIVCIIGVWICDKSSKMLGVHDHSGIVWDEFAGFFITMIAAPAGWIWIVAGFALFRLFDIWKPWPISWLDKKVEGGLGIMIDDIVAGIYALICLQLIHFALVSI